ncbi:hypothetical protein OQA88_5977 [Cercophora sp. LCS_1]
MWALHRARLQKRAPRTALWKVLTSKRPTCSSIRGIQTSGDALKLNQWRQDADGKTVTVSPRVYLVAADGKNYENVTLLGNELTFDVELSKLPCGMNGALYLSDMELDGGRKASGGLNTAGAEYGTGYCDAQCPVLGFINGAANTGKLGACCNEMDIWEANSRSTVYTPHPCRAERIRTCATELDCGQPSGYCDKWGCSYNPYAHGHRDFYGRGPENKVNTLLPFTVITQFHTSPTTGALANITRLYLQNGTVVRNTVTTAAGSTTDNINDAYCNATATWTQQRGGIEVMGQALARGMVLIFSLWADDGGYMTWMDSGSSGPCNSTEGDPRQIVQHTPDASVTFSNIRWGDIGSTFKK